MRRWIIVLLPLVAACSRDVPTKAFVKVKDKVCACTTADCATTLVNEVKHLRTLGSEPEDDELAKGALDEALVCAKKLDPGIVEKLQKAL